MTTTICYTCKEDIPPTAKNYGATFHGKNQSVCPDCAFGIFNGNNIFEKVEVSGEYMGPCGDNGGGIKP